MIHRALGIAALTLLLACDSKTVVVYSAHGRDILLEFERAFEAQHPGVDVSTVYMGSQELIERIRAERDNPQCAVWWGSDSVSMDAAAKEGLLLPYAPTYSSPGLPRHPENLWTGCFVLPIVVGYHPARLSASELPKTFAELADPRFRGKLVLREPAASGTMRTFVGAMLARSLEQTGSEAAGFDYLKRLDANVHHYAGTPELLWEDLERGPASITIWNLTDFVFQRGEKGYTFLPAGLNEPVPVIIDAIALVKGPGGSSPEARAYYEFVNTPEALASLARTHKRLPVREDFDRAKLDEGIRAVPFEPMKMDRALLAEKMPAWMRRFEEEVRGHR